jgi:hypothetical protein
MLTWERAPRPPRRPGRVGPQLSRIPICPSLREVRRQETTSQNPNSLPFIPATCPIDPAPPARPGQMHHPNPQRLLPRQRPASHPGRAVPYLPSKIHFLVASIIPENTWYIIPVEPSAAPASCSVAKPTSALAPAAKRRKNVAPGRKPWVAPKKNRKPGGIFGRLFSTVQRVSLAQPQRPLRCLISRDIL